MIPREDGKSARLITASWIALWQVRKREPLPLQPVRTSVGLPRFWPDARGFPVARLITPYKLRKYTGDEFAKRYRSRLDEYGVDKIRAELDEIAKACGWKPLVLLCFEQDPADCHRSQFGAWWQDQTGESISELNG